ncbi:alpha/beta hydrolase [Streptococcus chenjunshii]|uniref:Alpha/beta hydrolase n=1 Tax=Streptococcus chenjunshii TaxID=2173853 RepID=A0A372KMX0_9STRE|nr:alpha/beta hydrolase-fold protein [Streptococcus chenjunshii]AXQ79023.1 alpha/beta hydrolase [Streptococcus chenjunshii]RFU51449.1 alpha/beta hydrolase [Streptococcus chenjunshii]RFU53650.1 alpha/beta hydrolase [Streptococcus chenjunshii]
MKRTKLNNYYLEMAEHFLYVPYYDEERRIRVLLPKDYKKEDWATYPVLYMHDGQNIFYSKESFSGYSWKIIPTIKKHKEFPKLIIVGIDNAEENRLNEYAPWMTDVGTTPETASVGGDGMDYGEWVVNVVKPFIDNHYRTKPDRANTLLAGSSMGGIITAYMGAAYPQIFGNLGVFSLASWFSERDFLRYCNHHALNKQSKVYIQVGTKEGDDVDEAFAPDMNQAYIDCSLHYYQSLIKTGMPLENIRLRIMANEIHHEKHWAEHFVEFLQFTLKD